MTARLPHCAAAAAAGSPSDSGADSSLTSAVASLPVLTPSHVVKAVVVLRFDNYTEENAAREQVSRAALARSGARVVAHGYTGARVCVDAL